MRNRSLLLLVMVAALFSGCNKDPGKDNSVAIVNNTLTAGTWRITYFWNSGGDKTGNFTGYTFTFQSGGILNAVKGGSGEVGIWSALDRNDNDNCDLVISFITQNFFAELSKKWHVIEVTNIKVRMADDGGSGGAEYLTLEKN